MLFSRSLIAIFLVISASISFGQISYALVAGTPFTGLTNGDALFADIDGDSDLDVFIAGNTGQANLYSNDGVGNYTLVGGTPFTAVSDAACAFGDIDGDTDLDLILTGNNGATYVSELYQNDGTGTFTLIATHSFTAVRQGSVTFGDVDGDTDLDVIISGYTNVATRVTELHTNNGSGTFTLVGGTPFTPVNTGTVDFVDIDGDTDLDVLVTGDDGPAQIAELYTNNGTGTFTLVAGTPFTAVRSSDAQFGDVDGDTDMDLLLTGWDGAGRRAELYTNNGTGTFTLVAGTPFTALSSCAIDLADVDNDLDLDVLITGQKSPAITELYENDGVGTFTLVTGMPFTGIRSGDATFGDFDGDTDIDILISGWDETTRTTYLYTNEQTALPIELVSFNAELTSDQKVSLKWETMSEVDNDYFTVEKSSDGVHWTVLSQIDGAGNSIASLFYQLIDDAPYRGVSYYRLKQTDFNGEFSYAPIRSVNNLSLSSKKVRVYPNPTESQVIVEGDYVELNEVRVFDTYGKEILNANSFTFNGNRALIIDLSSLASGMYIVKTKSNILKVYKK